MIWFVKEPAKIAGEWDLDILCNEGIRVHCTLFLFHHFFTTIRKKLVVMILFSVFHHENETKQIKINKQTKKKIYRFGC